MAALDRHQNQLMLPVDGSDASSRALTWLLGNLHKEGDVINIVHVVPAEDLVVPVWYGAYGMENVIVPEDHSEEHIRDALAMIQERYAAALKEAGAIYRVHILRGQTYSGGIAAAIASKAEQLNVECCVMAHHPKSNMATWFQGSVCLDIINKAKMPLVIIR